MLFVEDLNQRGGAEHAYRIAVTTNPPQFSLAASLDTFNIPAGGTVMATVTTVRSGHAGPIELSALNLPAGVTASKSVIGAGRNDAVLTLQAAPEFAPGEIYNIQIVGTARIGDADVVVPAEIGGVLKARNNAMRWSPSPLHKFIAASASPAPGFTWRMEPGVVVFGKDLSAKFKLIATRAAGFDEGVVVAVTPPQNGLPAGVTVAVKNVEKGHPLAMLQQVSGLVKERKPELVVGLASKAQHNKCLGRTKPFSGAAHQTPFGRGLEHYGNANMRAYFNKLG